MDLEGHYWDLQNYMVAGRNSQLHKATLIRAFQL